MDEMVSRKEPFSVAFHINAVRDTMSLWSLIRHYLRVPGMDVRFYAAEEGRKACSALAGDEETRARVSILPETAIVKGVPCSVVFSANPYYPDEFYEGMVSMGARLVYIPYISVDISAEHLAGNFYNKRVHNLAWKIYVTNEDQADLFRLFCAEAKGRNAVNIRTTPKFDYIRQSLVREIETWPPRTFLWNIHYDAVPDPQSHQHGRTWSAFFHYRDEMFAFFRDNPELSLIIRPHPGMFEPEWNAMLDEVMRFGELPGVTVEDSKRVGYEGSFRRADILVSDLSSLAMVYFLTGKPVISLFCEHSCRVNAFAERFFRGFTYRVTEQGTLAAQLRALRDGQDAQRKRRLKALEGDKYFTLSRPAGDIIAEDVKRALNAPDNLI